MKGYALRAVSAVHTKEQSELFGFIDQQDREASELRGGAGQSRWKDAQQRRSFVPCIITQVGAKVMLIVLRQALAVRAAA